MTSFNLAPMDGLGLKSVVVSVTATGSTAAPAGISNETLNIYKMLLVPSAPVTIIFENGATALSGPISLAANQELILPMDGTPWFTCSVGASFNINSSAAVQISGTIYYTANPYGQ